MFQQKRNSLKGMKDLAVLMKTVPDVPKPNSPPQKIPFKIQKSTVVDEIERLKQKREERRQKQDMAKCQKAQKLQKQQQEGKRTDTQYEDLILQERLDPFESQPLHRITELRLCVAVRKRPLFEKEMVSGEIDNISCCNPALRIHFPKIKVDGISRFVENFDFNFDCVFGDNSETSELYECVLKGQLEEAFRKPSIITCFAYGQTGSGKTYTMRGIQDLLLHDIFVQKANQDSQSIAGSKASDFRQNQEILCKASQNNPDSKDYIRDPQRKDLFNINQRLNVYFSCLEIYAGKALDLLNGKEPLHVLEDKHQNIQIPNLTEVEVESYEQISEYIQHANSLRTTHSTTSNNESSRSHAVCWIKLRLNQFESKIILVDLAGSERAQDCQNNRKERRSEGAEINKSLLVLKECIRGLDQNSTHIPFRASKLTLLLRDSFVKHQNSSKIVMIACVSPGSSSSDHSINTLRYADRLKQSKSNQILPVANKTYQTIQNETIFEEIEFPWNTYETSTNKKELPNQKKEFSSSKTDQTAHFSTPRRPNQSSQGGIVKKNFDFKLNVKLADEKSILKLKNDFMTPTVTKPKSINCRNKENVILKKETKLLKHEQSLSVHKQNKLSSKYVAPATQMRSNKSFMCELPKQELKNLNKSYNDDYQKARHQQQQLFHNHMNTIQGDANLLTEEEQLIAHVKENGFMDENLSNYIEKFEGVLQTKLNMYTRLNEQFQQFRRKLKTLNN